MKDKFLLPDRPIAFNRDFVPIAGIKGALMLSQAVYWSRRTNDPEGWFYKTQEEWEEETGLTIEEQKALNKKLASLGYISIEKRGMPAQNHYKLNAEKVIEDLLGAPVGGKATHQSVENPPTSEGETHPLSITETTTEIEAGASKVTFEEWLMEQDVVSDYEGDGEVSVLVYRRGGKPVSEKTLRSEFAKAHPAPSKSLKKAPRTQDSFDFDSWLNHLSNSSKKVEKIIAFVWKERGYRFHNYDQWRSRMGQDVKYARMLEGYTPHQVKMVIDELFEEERKLGYKWSMSTIAKRIANTTL